MTEHLLSRVRSGFESVLRRNNVQKPTEKRSRSFSIKDLERFSLFKKLDELENGMSEINIDS